MSDEKPVEADSTGAVVRIRNIEGYFPTLHAERAVPKLTEVFALYLTHYPEVEIHYDGVLLNPRSVQKGRVEADLEPLELESGESVSAQLTLVEWTAEKGRSLFLCGADGYPIHEVKAGPRLRGHHYTGYLKCPQFEAWQREGRLALDELDPDLRAVLDRARAFIREHFDRQLADRTTHFLAKWTDGGVYPFEDEPRSASEAARRAAFALCGAALEEAVPGLDRAATEVRRVFFRLLRDVIETPSFDPADRLAKLLALPEETTAELAETFAKANR